jgi:enterochelin esterase family protein
VHGTISVGAKIDPKLPRTGTLALYWMPKRELDLVMSGSSDLSPLVTLLRTLTIVGPVDLSKPVRYALPVDRGELVISAVLDSQHALLGSILGHGGAGNLMGDSKPVIVDGNAVADIVLEQAVERPAKPEACTGARHELVTIDAPETAGASGNPTTRRSCVIVPPSYANGERRYPVIYMFPGWGQTDSDAIATFGYDKLLDEQEVKAGKEAILVIVDTQTKLGASYLVDSPVQGSWDSYITKRLVPEIDRRFRTRAAPRSRATAGHSTGGFGAVSIALRHPELFGVVTASAPDGLDPVRWLFGDGSAGGQTWALPMLRAEDATGGPGFFASYAADWSSDSSPRGFAFPVDPASGQQKPDVIARWREHSPAAWLSDPARAAAIRDAFSGRILIIAGKRDEFGLGEAAQQFHDALVQAKVESKLELPDTGHMDAATIVGGAFAYALTKLE